VEIQFTGLREGEKLNEELFYEHERVTPTACENIKRTDGAHRNWPELCRQLDELRASMSIDGAAPIRAKMREIVPEYSFGDSEGSWKISKVRVEKILKKAAGND
jgi:FlaA1/EpsC-like NDP-sugar epimerase